MLEDESCIRMIDAERINDRSGDRYHHDYRSARPHAHRPSVSYSRCGHMTYVEEGSPAMADDTPFRPRHAPSEPGLSALSGDQPRRRAHDRYPRRNSMGSKPLAKNSEFSRRARRSI